jgi:recombinational DNA repair ATPase RecF
VDDSLPSRHPSLLEDTCARLEADPALDEPTRDLALAALLDDLDAVLGGASPPTRERETRAPVTPPEVTLDTISVRGFRGIGERAVLKLPPGPGLTLVHGRNGSGKSSFAEALEMLLTGDNQRWSTRRSKIWRDGWRNLHDGDDVQLEARLLIAGRGAATVRRTWAKDDELDGGELEISFERATSNGGETAGATPGETTDNRSTDPTDPTDPADPPDPTDPPRTLADLGWTEPLQTWRPFLSYNELGSMLDDGPSALFDRLSEILGLEDLVDAAERLAEQRKPRDKGLRDAKKRAKELAARADEIAAASDDERARAASAALGKRGGADLDALAGALADQDAEPGAIHALLRELSDLALPESEELETRLDRAETALRAVAALERSDAGAAHRLAQLLQAALDHWDAEHAARAGGPASAEPGAEPAAEHAAEHAAEPAAEPAPCPVCGAPGRLDAAWRESTAAEIERLRARAEELRTARIELREARTELASSFPTPPAALREDTPRDALATQLADHEPPVDLRATVAAWTAWSDLSRSPSPPALVAAGVPSGRPAGQAALPRDHATSPEPDDPTTRRRHPTPPGDRDADLLAPDLRASNLGDPDLRAPDLRGPDLRTLATHLHHHLTTLRAAAAALHEAREDLWRPLAAALREWLPAARRAEADAALAKRLKQAEDWLREIATDMRNERFAPIKDQVIRHWEQLRTRSHVSLDDVRFEGKSTSRRIEMDVSVDGRDAVALGVMSQGELHALALSLFLPRATMPESPFRFVMIDDPVQAMDPARVDGLARVLRSVAADRQVVVFTHDNRLPEAVRRLQIPATILDVERDRGSQVKVVPGLDPVERHLAEARALVRTEGMPVDVIERVVPGFCRLALEAACIETTRRRRLAAGRPHAEVENDLQAHEKLLPRLALALFDDGERASEVMTAINQKWGRANGDLVQICNKGAHKGERGVDTKFVTPSRSSRRSGVGELARRRSGASRRDVLLESS